MEILEKVFSNHGIAVAILIVILFWAWRLANWMKPLIEDLFDGHKVFLEETASNTRQNTECIEKIGVCMERIEGTHKTLEECVARLADNHDRCHEEMKRICQSKTIAHS